MNRPVSKITLSSARDIPFNKLVLSQSNVRRIKAGQSIEDLAESIARRGLIQSLHVREVLDQDSQPTGMFEVPAGGRRFAALQQLVRQKRLSKTTPIPCIVSDTDSEVMIEEVSLAENIERAPLHPLDQFRAFVALRDKGMSEEAIAAAFFISVQVVRQRLRLAHVAPSLLQLYADDAMSLEVLMAFTITPDHDRQIQVWESIQHDWQREPWQVRRRLTESTVRASDKRALFVGLQAYASQGGQILRDLFEADEGGWLQDVALLDRLVSEKLQAVADMIALEGWKWIEAQVSLPYGVSHGLRYLSGLHTDLDPDELAQRQSVQAQYNALSAQYEGSEELPTEVDALLGALEATMEAFDKRPKQYDPQDLARAGVFISICADGSVCIDRGYVRPQDEPVANIDEADPKTQTNAQTSQSMDAGHPDGVINDSEGSPMRRDDAVADSDIGANQPTPAEDEDDAIKPLPERLMLELTAWRTLALRDAIASHPQVAMTALLYKLAGDLFQQRTCTGALEVRVQQVHFPAQDPGLKDSAPALAIARRHQAFADRMPAGDSALWDWIAGLDLAEQLDLLAHCLSFGINALHEKPNPYAGSGLTRHGMEQRLAQADRLARCTGLDLHAAGWRPTIDTYLGRVTKSRIRAAVAQGAGERAAGLIDHLKKDEMASQAERLLADTAWLPEPLRSSDGPAFVGHPTFADGETAETAAPALPAFLDEDPAPQDSKDEAIAEDEPHSTPHDAVGVDDVAQFAGVMAAQ